MLNTGNYNRYNNTVSCSSYTNGGWKTKKFDALSFETHVVESYHVSCSSDHVSSYYGDDDLGGIVLYMKDGKTEWNCNGIHCQIGTYVSIMHAHKRKSKFSHNFNKLHRLYCHQKSEKVKNCGSSWGAIHGNVYKSVFGREPHGVVGSGFSYDASLRKWKWNSGVFNANDIGAASGDFHTLFGDWNIDKMMNPQEQKWIDASIKNWINKGQYTTQTDGKFILYGKLKWNQRTSYESSGGSASSNGGCTIL